MSWPVAVVVLNVDTEKGDVALSSTVRGNQDDNPHNVRQRVELANSQKRGGDDSSDGRHHQRGRSQSHYIASRCRPAPEDSICLQICKLSRHANAFGRFQ